MAEFSKYSILFHENDGKGNGVTQCVHSAPMHIGQFEGQRGNLAVPYSYVVGREGVHVHNHIILGGLTHDPPYYITAPVWSYGIIPQS